MSGHHLILRRAQQVPGKAGEEAGDEHFQRDPEGGAGDGPEGALGPAPGEHTVEVCQREGGAPARCGLRLWSLTGTAARPRWRGRGRGRRSTRASRRPGRAGSSASGRESGAASRGRRGNRPGRRRSRCGSFPSRFCPGRPRASARGQPTPGRRCRSWGRRRPAGARRRSPRGNGCAGMGWPREFSPAPACR